MALHISSSEKRPFDPSWTCLCIVHLTVKGHSACTAASQSSLYPKCQSAHCKTHVAMRQQRPDPSMGTTESSHGWLEVTEPKERQTQINSSVQRALIQQAISLFALKMTIQNRKPPYRETFTFGTVPCAKHFLCELDLFPPLQTQMRCLHHHLLPLTQWSSTKTYFLLNQTFFFFFPKLCGSGARNTLPTVAEKKTMLPQRSPDQISVALSKLPRRDYTICWEKKTNLRIVVVVVFRHMTFLWCSIC